MTVICALYDPDEENFWLGSNSGSQIGSTILPEHKSKWNIFGDWAVAMAGRGLARDLIMAERAKFPIQSDDINLVTDYFRKTFERYGVGHDNNGYKDYRISGLVVHRSGSLYDIDNNTAVSSLPVDTLWSRGSGMDYALGADEVSKIVNFSAEKRIQNAVDAAIALDTDCPGETIVERF